MDREQTKELLPIIQAFADGKNVQFHDGNCWIDTPRPTFVASVKWRIKPNPPQEFYITVYGDAFTAVGCGFGGYAASIGSIYQESPKVTAPGARIFKVTEVMKE